MLVLRRVLDQFCEKNKVSLDDPLAIAAAQELVRMWQMGDPTEAELASDLTHLTDAHHGAAISQPQAMGL
ncbi:hypothetical protein [Neorhizobium sp. JUb45]|uniref:hypothetical protein n=1 Tax=unclassified Neorhizobium TaxID=2629175 RepID=UPI00104CD4C6|nr:hypothetical protein [Neorhizobium sp. JUb45]TCR03068.1 hypothetical protein EDF70_103496 [Neorhizobium sp. JUb45]